MPEPKPTVEDLLNAIVADQPANIKKHFASSVSLMNGLVWGLYNYFGGSSVEWAIDEIRVCIRFAENALKTLPHGHGRTSEVISYAGKSDRCWSRIVLKHGRLLVMAFDEIPNHEFFHSKEYDLDFVSAHLDIEFEGSGFPDWNTLARIAENPPSVPNDAQSLLGPSLTILPDEDAAGQLLREDELVTYTEIAERLTMAGHEISERTLSNHHKNILGEPDGQRGNAYMFSWNRIRPTLEEKFTVKF